MFSKKKTVWWNVSVNHPACFVSCWGRVLHTGCHNKNVLKRNSAAHLFQELGHIIDFVVDDDPRWFERVLAIDLRQSVIFHSIGALFLLFTHLCSWKLRRSESREPLEAERSGYTSCVRLYNPAECVRTVRTNIPTFTPVFINSPKFHQCQITAVKTDTMQHESSGRFLQNKGLHELCGKTSFGLRFSSMRKNLQWSALIDPSTLDTYTMYKNILI